LSALVFLSKYYAGYLAGRRRGLLFPRQLPDAILKIMRHAHRLLLGFLTGALPLVAMLAGCEAEPPSRPEAKSKDSAPAVEVKKAPFGRNVWLETQGEKRRVLIKSYVCLREGQLEQLLCRRHTKEHEAILAADLDAKDIHTVLMLAGAEPGSVVQYEPTYRPPTGQKIKITLQYEEAGKLITTTAQKWVRDAQTRKDLEYDWVFAGSALYPDPLDKAKPPFYGANVGDVICVSNFEDALLDLPIKSSKDNAELVYEANTERIPPLETVVTIILEPLPNDQKPRK
jgi:hypothetical protein